MNPGAVETELERLMERLMTETERLAELAEAAARTEVTHKHQRARALLRAEGTVAEREAVADLDTSDAYLARRVAEEAYRSQRELLLSLRAQIDALRTLAANLRAIV